MAEESQPERPLLRATEEPSSSVHSLLMGRLLFLSTSWFCWYSPISRMPNLFLLLLQF